MVTRRERLRLFEVVGETTTTAVVRGIINVPEEKPEVQKVLGVIDVAVSATGSTIPDKVVIQGTVAVQILYVAALPDQPVHHVSGTLDLMQFANVPGAQPGMAVQLQTRVTFSNVIIRAPRELQVEIVLEIFVKVLQPVELDVVTDVRFKNIPVKVEKELIKVEHVIAENQAQLVIRDTMSVPEAKPDVGKIIGIQRQEVTFTEVRVIPDRVVVQGTLTMQIIYVAALPDQPVHHMEVTEDFFQQITVPGAAPGMTARVTPSIEFAQVTLVDPRTIFKEVILKLVAEVIEIQQVRVVTDVWSDRIPVKIERRLVKVEEVVTEATRQINIRRQVTIPEEKPNAIKILNVFDTRVDITRAEVVDNKVVIEGTLVVQIIYVAALPDQPVHSTHQEIQFIEYIDMPGAAPGMTVQVRPTVEFVRAQLVPPEEQLPPEGTNQILIDVILEVFAKVTKMVQKYVVVDVGIPEDWRDI